MPLNNQNHAKGSYNSQLYALYGSTASSEGTSGGSGGY